MTTSAVTTRVLTSPAVLAAAGVALVVGGWWLGGAHERRRQYRHNRESTYLHYYWKRGYDRRFTPMGVDLLLFPKRRHDCETKEPARDVDPEESVWAALRAKQRDGFRKTVRRLLLPLTPKDGSGDVVVYSASEWLSVSELTAFITLYDQYMVAAADACLQDDSCAAGTERDRLYATIERILMKWRLRTRECAVCVAETAVTVGAIVGVACISTRLFSSRRITPSNQL
jgi:hypothetical protein